LDHLNDDENNGSGHGAETNTTNNVSFDSGNDKKYDNLENDTSG